jgi:VanZ family protein
LHFWLFQDYRKRCQEADAMIDEATLQHFILGMMMALSYPIFRRFKYIYLGLIFIHPFIIEGVQFFMPGRTPDTADIMVGLTGTLLGFCLI